MKRTFLALAAALVPALGHAAVTVKGSDTMVILAQRWAEVYMNKNAGKRVQVTGGGSGIGIAALINGTTDVANASRPMKDAEKAKVRDRFNVLPTEIAVARDGLAVYVPESNPIEQLTLAQLKAIYMGDVTNWKVVGGPDAPIVLYSRENSSGTYVFFKDNVLGGGDFAAELRRGEVVRFMLGTERQTYYLHFSLRGFAAAADRTLALCRQAEPSLRVPRQPKPGGTADRDYFSE